MEIKPTGKTTGEVVWEWHLWDHLVQDFDKSKANFGNVAEHPELVNINYGEDELPSVIAAAAKDGKDKPKADDKPAANRPPRINPDYTHFNGVDYNPDLDQISVSVWAFSEFWIIDHGTTTAQAASHTGGRMARAVICSTAGAIRGPIGPGRRRTGSSFPSTTHTGFPGVFPAQGICCCSTTAPSGRDRMGTIRRWTSWCSPPIRRGDTCASRARPTGRTNPCGATPRPRRPDFYSSFISGTQRLSNGNTLICSGANGTIFEVTPEKAIVWKYVNPVKNDTPIGTPPRPGQIMTPIAGEMLVISADQRKQLDEIQKDIDAHLDKLLTADQKKQAAEWPRDPGGNGFDPSPQPGQVMAGPEQNRLKLTDDQKKDVLALQKAIDGRFDKVLTAAQQHQIKTVFAPFGPPGGPGPRSRRSSAARQDLLSDTTRHLEALRRAEEASGGDSEGDRREARDVAHGGPEKPAPGDAATPRRRRAGRAAVPRADVRSSAPFVMQPASPDSRARTLTTGKNLGGIAAEGA